MNESICSGCGKKILWVVTPTGAKIPLDPSAPVYVSKEFGVWELVPVAQRKVIGPAVSHFSTCPKANEFSASRKENKPCS